MPSIPHARNDSPNDSPARALTPDYRPLIAPVAFPYALIPTMLTATRRATRIPAPALFNRPLPGVFEMQCPGCGALTCGPRAGWTPAAYDADGALRPLRLAVQLSDLCRLCHALDQRLAELRAGQRRKRITPSQYLQMRAYLYALAGAAV